MQKTLMDMLTLDDHLDCFGEFDSNDPICTKRCAINLRCAIESDKKARLELLDDLVETDSLFMKIQ